MSTITTVKLDDGSIVSRLLTPNLNKDKIIDEVSKYDPDEDCKKAIEMVRHHFTLGNVTMLKPRREFNDLSVLERDANDRMAANTYNPNDGDALEGDDTNSWKSRAKRPVVFNKIESIAAHTTARLVYPKVFAADPESNEQSEAAKVMESLMEHSNESANYTMTALRAVRAACVSPAAIIYSEYADVYRNIKLEKNKDGTWKWKTVLDKVFSGFQDVVIPVEQLYIENIYEPDIQKQGWLIWRRVQSYSTMETKYRSYENFQYVKPGVQLVYNDANQAFYEVYDVNMRQENCEEIIYWNRNLDLKLILVNGVLLTPHDNPNPRIDKYYPFSKFGAHLIGELFFYYKSFAFAALQDEKIINTLYPMIIDGTYLNLMPPMINRGSEKIGSDVIIPGQVTTLGDPNAQLESLKLSTNLKAGMDTLFKVEESISESTAPSISGGNPQAGTQTAYEIAKQEQNAETMLGLFVKMMGDFVRQFGTLRVGDILQHLTVPDLMEIEGDNPKGQELIYKTFLLHDKYSEGKTTTRKIMFDLGLPDEPQDQEAKLKASYNVLAEQGGINSKLELYKVNPSLFRQLDFMCVVSPDVLHPRSEDLDRAYATEFLDKAITNPSANQEEAWRNYVSHNPLTKRNPEKFIQQQPQMAGGAGLPGQAQPGQASAPAPVGKASAPKGQPTGLPVGMSTPSPSLVR